MLSLKSFTWIALAALAIVLIGAGCSRAMAKSKPKSPYLTLFAFNYSDRYLYDTRVDGTWMGGVSAYTDSGSVMGPLAPRTDKPITLDVRWKLSGRYDLKTNTYEKVGPLEPRSAQVTVRQPYPADPHTLLLHFYADGHVEAELLERGKDPWDLRREKIPEGHIANQGL
ncbi:hypothetical protein SOM22_14580 [Stenotrophomonas rhizophila]|jgi:hypothetical protein|uniref:hypothetical protein n=1 Tax=Stenotrophomonas rhizophila TaxID=216778 RepID=UPI002A6AD119|nr:hypothetical protein [Stenotrophomonas rhizophila]MDY0955801.1 hypothetical protein [Stenotrophomonas rhizophila]